jgi:non-specific serine/threonine protein kinase
MLGVLSGLVQKSMVVAEVADGSDTRFRLLESQHAYAEDRLLESGDLDIMRSRHYEYFREKADSRAIKALPSSIPRAEWKKSESANLWAAAAWARTHVEDLGLSLVVDMNIADFNQSRAVIDDLLAHYPIQGIVRARGLETAAFIAWVQGDHQVGLQRAQSSVALAREVGDVRQLADSLNVLGMALQGLGELAAAASAYDEAINLLSDSGNPAMMGTIKNSVGILAIQRGDYAAAAETLADVVATGRAEGDPWATLGYLDSLAWAQLGLGDYPAATASWRESLSIASRLTDPFGVLVCLQGLSCAASSVHDDRRALRLAAAAEQMASAESLGTDSWMLRQLKESELQSRSRLGTRKSEEAWNQGVRMAAEQAVAYALEGIEPEAVTDAGPLSRREQEVVRLVAAGLTNRQIGERLFITERSAEGHLERIRNKLGVRSRTGVATWATGHGLASDPGAPGEEDRAGSSSTGPRN